jgi:hypothetical protein
VKVFDLFNNLDIFSIQPGTDKIMISTRGTYQLSEPLSSQNFNAKHD